MISYIDFIYHIIKIIIHTHTQKSKQNMLTYNRRSIKQHLNKKAKKKKNSIETYFLFSWLFFCLRSDAKYSNKIHLSAI